MGVATLTEDAQEHLLQLMRPEEAATGRFAVAQAILQCVESLDESLHVSALAFVFEHRFVARWAPVPTMPHSAYPPSVEVQLAPEEWREVDALCQDVATMRERQGMSVVDAAERVVAYLRRFTTDFTHRIGVFTIVLNAFAFDFGAVAMRSEDIEHDDVEGDERVRTLWKHRRAYAQLRGLLLSRCPTNMSGFGWKLFEIVRAIEDPRERGIVLGSFCKLLMERGAR